MNKQYEQLLLALFKNAILFCLVSTHTNAHETFESRLTTHIVAKFSFVIYLIVRTTANALVTSSYPNFMK